MNVIWSKTSCRPSTISWRGAPPAAERLAESVIALVERLATEPLDGAVHILSDGERVHGWPFPPFRIYYQRTPEAFLVVRIYHQRREPITR